MGFYGGSEIVHSKALTVVMVFVIWVGFSRRALCV